MNWDVIVGFINIVIIDLALSGDNAIVIGMAAASLPRNRRTKAIIFGGICAVVLRIALTAIATTLMRITLISAVAGIVLFWVAWKLLRLDTTEEAEKSKIREAQNFRQAVLIIIMADFMLSLDNVLAVAGAAHGSYPLLVIGLLMSMPLLMTTGSIISRLIDKFRWLPLLGAAVIFFTATRMILEDKFIEPRLDLSLTPILIISTLIGLLLPAIITSINKLKTVQLNRKNAGRLLCGVEHHSRDKTKPLL